MRRFVVPLVALSALLNVGCQESAVSAPYEPITLDPPTRSATSSDNAYVNYVALSSQALSSTDIKFDTKDTRSNREELLRDIGHLTEQLALSTEMPCSFTFVPSLPFEGGANHEGWILLGKALVWNIEESAGRAEWGEAVRWTIVATTFGTDLGGGDFSDASLGYGIVDSARRAIAQQLPLIPLESLNALADGLDRAISRWPSAAQTVHNEGQDMLAAIKALQDAHESGEIESFASHLYGRSKSAVTGLADLDGTKRSEFFRSLIQEREKVVDQLTVSAEVPGAQRSRVSFALDGRARVVADQFFTTGDPWFSMRDRTKARTHLLATTVRIYAYISMNGEAPKNLNDLDANALTDPYTGRQLNYSYQGRGFLLYSSGVNGVHDQGETDTDKLAPDMYLEDAVL